MSTTFLKFPQQLGIRSADEIVTALAPVARCLEVQEPLQITLDMREVFRVYPTGMAMVSASVLNLQSRGLCSKLDVIVPSDTETHSYITRMGFHSLLGFDVPY